MVEEPKKQWNKIFIDEILAIRVSMYCRTTSVHKVTKRLGN